MLDTLLFAGSRAVASNALLSGMGGVACGYERARVYQYLPLAVTVASNVVTMLYSRFLFSLYAGVFSFAMGYVISNVLSTAKKSELEGLVE